MLETTICKWALADGSIVATTNTYGPLARELAANGANGGTSRTFKYKKVSSIPGAPLPPTSCRRSGYQNDKDKARSFKKTAYRFYKDVWGGLIKAQKHVALGQALETWMDEQSRTLFTTQINEASPHCTSSSLSEDDWGAFVSAARPADTANARPLAKCPDDFHTPTRSSMSYRTAISHASSHCDAASHDPMSSACSSSGHVSRAHSNFPDAAVNTAAGAFEIDPFTSPAIGSCGGSAASPSASPVPCHHGGRNLATSSSMQRRLHDMLMEAASTVPHKSNSSEKGTRTCVVPLSAGAISTLRHAQALLAASIVAHEERIAAKREAKRHKAAGALDPSHAKEQEALPSAESLVAGRNARQCAEAAATETGFQGGMRDPATALVATVVSELTSVASVGPDLGSAGTAGAATLSSVHSVPGSLFRTGEREVISSGADEGEVKTPTSLSRRAYSLCGAACPPNGGCPSDTTSRLRCSGSSLKRLPWKAREVEGEKTQEGASRAAVRHEDGRVALQAALSMGPFW